MKEIENTVAEYFDKINDMGIVKLANKKFKKYYRETDKEELKKGTALLTKTKETAVLLQVIKDSVLKKENIDKIINLHEDIWIQVLSKIVKLEENLEPFGYMVQIF